MNVRSQLGFAIAALMLVGCMEPPAQQPPDTRAVDEAAIRARVQEWSGSAQAKDAEKFISFYTEDAVVMLEDAPDLRGMAALRDGISNMMQDPNFALQFEADQVVVARSGDLAFETGTYTMTMTDPEQVPATENGNYVVVWRKQADGSWKVAVDVPVSDPPVATPSDSTANP